ncbi:MAG: ABC transporter ATP-binding protein, partial [Ruminococcaceae bacterium]|nr:ABC transporter ATP-binding protein [Oscillospiraceae bacterium]
LTFDNVSFAYETGRDEVLHDVSFTLPFGSVTALVGRSGAGKSTTADLLLGLLYPKNGKITVDGTPLTSENMTSWHQMIGYVPQEPMLLNTSVRDNLLRFHPEATEEDIAEALKQAQAWDFVEKLEQKLDTVIGDKGVRLSGGQRQRIVLARVLLGKPKLIILDEATSALDYESENAVRDTIRTLKDRSTVLIIAHRLATIRGADYAIVLEDGRVAEQGSMQELLNKSEGYLNRMLSVE